MAPRKRRTTSATRGKNKGKGASKVTGKTPQSRANRQKASNARVTKGGQGGGCGRVTNAAQRTSTGRARVTGGRPALPPGKKGGSIVKSNARRTAAQNKAGRAAAVLRVLPCVLDKSLEQLSSKHEHKKLKVLCGLAPTPKTLQN